MNIDNSDFVTEYHGDKFDKANKKTRISEEQGSLFVIYFWPEIVHPI